MAVNFGVNPLAVIVAAVVALVIGFAWYAPQTFGRRWMTYLGTTQAQLGNPGPMGMLTGVVASLLNAWVLAVLALNLGGTTITDGVLLGILCWLGFMFAQSPERITCWGIPKYLSNIVVTRMPPELSVGLTTVVVSRRLL